MQIFGEAAGSKDLKFVDLQNIQNVELQGVVNGGAAAILDSSTHTSVTNVTLKNVFDTTTGGSSDIIVNLALTGQTIGLEGTISADDGNGLTLAFVGSNKGTDDAVAMTLKNVTVTDDDAATVKGVTMAKIEHLTITATGKNDLAKLAADKLQDLTIKGAGAVSGAVDTDATTLASITATDAGGTDLTVDTGDMAAAFTYAGGSKADKLSITGALNTAKMTVALGEGDNELTVAPTAAGINAGSSFTAGNGTNDKLIVSGSVFTPATGAQFSGFEVLSTVIAQNLSFVSGIKSVEVTGDVGLTGLNAEQAAHISLAADNSSKTFSLATAAESNNNALGLTLKGTTATAEIDATALTINGFEHLSVSALTGAKDIKGTAGTSYSNVTLAAATSLTSVDLLGDYALAFDADNAALLKKVDAGKNTAGVQLTLDDQALTFTGSTASDSIIGTIAEITAAAKLDGGAGADALHVTDSATVSEKTFAIEDSMFWHVAQVENIVVDGAHAGITSITLGARAADLAVSNGGRIAVSAANLTAADASKDSVIFDSHTMDKGAAVDLTLKNTGSAKAINVTTGEGADVINVELAGNSATTSTVTISSGAGDDAVTFKSATGITSAADLVIRGGGGNDSITLGDNDATIKFEASATANGADVIKDFTVGASADTLNFNLYIDGTTCDYNSTAVSESSTTAAATANNNLYLVSVADISTTQFTEDHFFGAGKAFAAEGTSAKKMIFVVGEATGTDGVQIFYVTDGVGADDMVISQVATLEGINITGLTTDNFTYTI